MGWHRATLFYRVVTGSGKYPSPGSLQETLMLLVHKRVQEIEFTSTLAMVQALTDPSKAKEAFDEYRNSSFPYLVGAERFQQSQAKKVMERFFSFGPMKLHEIASATSATRQKRRKRPVLDKYRIQPGRRLS